MNQSSSATDRADAIRQKTLAAVTAVAERGRAFDLPAPSTGLESYRRKLADNTYQVLVVGEAKRGKSTFINSLIGRPLLPTDVDIATSQVFRICPADTEAYRLRFEDDTVRAIDAADLPRYGSQVVADREGAPALDEIIRWIEIDVPVRFLPANVRLLDTPGLGALYAAHAQITYRFVPHADAVLFVLDSQAPIGEPEMRFIEKLLDVTRNVFFIQTKIDQFRRDAWQAIQQRNQDILRQRFAGRLPDPRVWPFSSTNLAKVAATDDADYLQVSRYPELFAALQAFLFRVTGWDRAAVASVLASDYHAQGRSVLSLRLASLADDPGARPDASAWAARRAQFASDWSESGAAYQKLRGQVRSAANQSKRAITQALHTSSTMEMEHRAHIDELKSAEQAREFAARLGDELVAQASKHWKQTVEAFRLVCNEAFAPFWQANRVLDDFAAAADPGLSVQPSHGLAEGGNYYRRTKAAMREFSWAAGVTVAAASAAGLLAATSVLLPVAIIAVLGIGALAAFQGWRDVAAKELKLAQRELHKQLTSVLAQIRLQFLGGDAGGGLVDDFFRTQVRELDQHLQALVKKKLAELDAEAAHLAENARLDAGRRAARAEQIRGQMQQWEETGKQIEAIQAELQELEKSWQSG